MSEIKVASRYAKSLLDLAKEQNKVEDVHNDMKLFHDTVKASSQLRAVLSNPIISAYDKKEILRKLFEGKVGEVTLSFFNIMISKGREAFLYETARQFFAMYNVFKGIVTAKVVSATPLSDVTKREVEAIVEKAVNAKVSLEASVDAGLIGGFVITVGDKQFDASIAKKLKGLKKEFAGDSFVSSI